MLRTVRHNHKIANPQVESPLNGAPSFRRNALVMAMAAASLIGSSSVWAAETTSYCVSDAGTNAANGTYTGAGTTFTGPSPWSIQGGEGWALKENATIHYNAGTLTGAWSTATDGTGPAPTVTAGDCVDWQVVGSADFSANSASDVSLAIAADGTPYMAFKDNGNATSVMKFSGGAWSLVGNAGFSAGNTSNELLAFAPAGTPNAGQPYVAYADGENGWGLTVMRFDGTNWVGVGSPDLANGGGGSPSFAIAPDGTPYISFQDGTNGGLASVMKFDGTAWVSVGSVGFSEGNVSDTSLAFASNGTPYVAYRDGGNASKATVMKFNGTAWVGVGTPGFSAGADVYTPSLAFAPDGTPYVAYADSVGGTYKATVMKFNGTAWVAVGAVVSSGDAYYESLVIAADGTPYVAYMDVANGSKTTVMKFDGTSWGVVGHAGISAGSISNVSLAIAPDQSLYVGYGNGAGSFKANVFKFAAAVATTPSVSAIALAGSPATSATSMNFTVVFSEAVSGVDANDFMLVTTGNAVGTIGLPNSSDGGTTWTVPITGISGFGTLRLNLNSSGTGIAATAAGNTAIGGGFTGGSTHTLNTTTTAAVMTLAGGGGGITFGYANGSGTAATFHDPSGVAVDSSGNVYVADPTNNLIRKITPAGVVSTLAGGGSTGSESGNADGNGTAASFFNPYSVAVDGSGNVYVADYGNNRIRKIDSSGNVTTLAGGAYGYLDGTGTAAKFNGPDGVAVDSSGNVYVADYNNNRIRKITPAGVVSTLAGSGAQGHANGLGTAATFKHPFGVAVDSSGNVYVADYDGNNLIRKITPEGLVSTLAGGGSDGAIASGHADGLGTAATFHFPAGVAVDGSGNVYVADGSNNLIRKIDSSGNVTTLAGGGSAGSITSGHADDGGTAATFSNPNGIAVDSNGNLYVADTSNHMIRKIIPAAAAVAPSVSSITLAGSPATNATSVSYTVVFSAAVSGVDASDFSLSVMSMSSLTGTIGTPTSSDGGTTWTVPVSGISGAGIMRLDLNSSGTGIAATAAGNMAISGGFTGGSDHTADTSAPTVTTLTFNTASTDFTGNFTQSNPATGSFTWNATIGLGGSGGVSIASGDQIWTATNGHAVAANGVYTASVYLKSPANSGFGALGFSIQSQDSNAGSYAAPAGSSMGMFFHAGGGGFINNGPIKSDGTPAANDGPVYWLNEDGSIPSDGSWVKVEFTATARGGNKYDLNFKVYNSTYQGEVGSLITEHTLTDNMNDVTRRGPAVTNAAVGGASTLYPFISMEGSRFSVMDNFSTQVGTVPIAVPGLPTNVSVIPGNGSATVSFTPPASDGGAAITGYTATCAPAGSNTFDEVVSDPSASGTASPITVSGLTNGTSYRCYVQATNSAGTTNGIDFSSPTAVSNTSVAFTPVAPVSAPSGSGYTPPSNPTLPSGGGSITPTTGQTVDVSDNGQSGSTVNLPNSGGTAPASVTFNLPGTGSVNIASNDKDSQIAVQQTTVGGKTVSTLSVTQGSATATATVAGQALVGTKDAGIVVSANDKGASASMTMTNGNANLGVSGGSTITVQSGAQVSGTTIDLAPGSGGNKTVTVEVGGQTLQVLVGSASAQVSFTKVDIGGVSTPVLTVTGGGVLNVTAQNSGAPLLAVGNGGTLVQAAGGNNCQSVVNTQSDSQHTDVHVATCSVVLPANAFAGQGFAAVKDNTVLVGETVEFDASGKVKKVRLGTLAGDTSIAGDKRARTNTAALEYRAWIPQLDAIPTRFDSTQKLSDAIVALVAKQAPDFSFQGMQADGSLRFATADGRLVSALPVETVEVDTSQPDGFSVDAHNKVKVATGGLITRFSANPTDLEGFAAGVQAICPTCKTVQIDDGNLHVTNGDIAYVGVADWYVYAKPGADGFNVNPYGPVSYAATGRDQPIYPTTGDLEAIQAAVQALDANGTAAIQSDGSVLLQIGSNRYTLMPDYALQLKAPADHANDAWWQGSDGHIYLKNRNGSVQGFVVK